MPPHIVSDDEVWIENPIPRRGGLRGPRPGKAATAIGIWQGSSLEQSGPACHMTRRLQLPRRMPSGGRYGPPCMAPLEPAFNQYAIEPHTFSCPAGHRATHRPPVAAQPQHTLNLTKLFPCIPLLMSLKRQPSSLRRLPCPCSNPDRKNQSPCATTVGYSPAGRRLQHEDAPFPIELPDAGHALLSVDNLAGYSPLVARLYSVRLEPTCYRSSASDLSRAFDIGCPICSH